MSEFKEGMVVQLKSGGPKMTVVGLSPEYEKSIVCEWFVEKEVKSGLFHPASLDVVEEE